MKFYCFIENEKFATFTSFESAVEFIETNGWALTTEKTYCTWVETAEGDIVAAFN